jgi:uncharacterized membrane protein
VILQVFILSGVTGLGAVVGSMVGHGVGGRGLIVGALIGGLMALYGATALVQRLRLIAPRQRVGTLLGAAIGFLIAALIAVRTASSPIGPILSSLLVGLGGLAGRHATSATPSG